MKEVLITSSVLILALLALRGIFRRSLSRRVQYALWGLVALRLLLPVEPGQEGQRALLFLRESPRERRVLPAEPQPPEGP